MKQQKIKIGATQINNGFSGQFYLPYSIGLLYAFILRNSENPEKFSFNSIVYKRKLLNECFEHLKDRDVVLFSTYVWNEKISLAIAEKLKKFDKNRFEQIKYGHNNPDSTWEDEQKFYEGYNKYVKVNEKIIDEQKFLNSIKTTNFNNLKNKELNEGFEESVYSKITGKKINFFNLGFNNRWQKLLPSDIKTAINKKLNKELEELGY